MYFLYGFYCKIASVYYQNEIDADEFSIAMIKIQPMITRFVSAKF